MTIETAFLAELQRVLAAQERGFQTELARKLKMKPSTFSNMVNGRRGIPEDLRPKMAELAGIDGDRLASLSRRELIRLYRRKAHELHPDKGGDTDRFVRLTAAYEELLRWIVS